jgi:hypothetical protein
MPSMLRVRQRRRDRPPQADLQGFIAEGVDLVGAVDKVRHRAGLIGGRLLSWVQSSG